MDKSGLLPAQGCCEFIRLICHLELTQLHRVSKGGRLHVTHGCRGGSHAAEIIFVDVF